MTEPSLLVTLDGPVAVVTLNRPASKNALTTQLVDELGATLERLGQDATIRALVLTGAGGSFCSGADLKAATEEGLALIEQAGERIDRFHRIIRAIVAAPKPVIAAIDGPAVGFGCDMALACDLRVATDRAYFQEKFIRIGLMPDGGGTLWLPRLIGTARAMELFLTGDALSAEQARELGIVRRVVPTERLSEEAHELAKQLAKAPPIAVRNIKQAVNGAAALGQALQRERVGQIECLKSQDCMEGILAWMQKREPSFQGK